jgi:hypothetical protein
VGPPAPRSSASHTCTAGDERVLLIERVPHSTEWAIALSLLVFAYATARAQKRTSGNP